MVGYALWFQGTVPDISSVLYRRRLVLKVLMNHRLPAGCTANYCEVPIKRT